MQEKIEIIKHGTAEAIQKYFIYTYMIYIQHAK
jgi:hypothetical protein